MGYLAVDRNSLISDLKQNVLEIRFRKVDDSIRIMRSTLHQGYLPADVRTKEQIDEAINRERTPDVVTVWDVDNNGWRSVRLNSIYSVQLINGY